jgi:hypothetical protein
MRNRDQILSLELSIYTESVLSLETATGNATTTPMGIFVRLYKICTLHKELVLFQKYMNKVLITRTDIEPDNFLTTMTE